MSDPFNDPWPLEPRPRFTDPSRSTFYVPTGISVPWDPQANTIQETAGSVMALFRQWREADIANGGTGIPDDYVAPPAPFEPQARRCQDALAAITVLRSTGRPNQQACEAVLEVLVDGQPPNGLCHRVAEAIRETLV